ncbi:cupin domain-containing protein [Nocardioides sp. LHG3406-4]|uniref:cupin domain-containing protein n=1 Tax=Nocardioides sp. LHG3406-4 TaxID=2804575 RepID=UPI003CEF83B2
MSYPPPIYDGDTGELTATIRTHGTDPELVYPNGNTISILSTGDTTGGLYGLYRYDFAGPRSGPDSHFHKTVTEAFYILSGEVTVYDGRAWQPARPGDYLYVPAGGLHGFRNESGAEASMLLHFAPGAPREEYFEGLARLAAGETMTDAERDAFMKYHDNHWA